MLIALDYDKTYTRDPSYWDQVIALGQQRGHEFVCVTGRREPPGSHELHIPIPVLCAPSQWKRHAAMAAGYHVDVWIDDMPEMIAPGRVLAWD